MGADSLSPKIRQLKGCRLTPDTVLARTLDKREHIKAVAIVIQWNDDSCDVDWSQMTISSLSCMSLALQMEVMEDIRAHRDK